MQQQANTYIANLSGSAKRVIIYICVFQGVLLLGIHELIARGWWPATSIPLRTLWYTLALALPTAGWMLLRNVRDRRLWIMLLGYGVLLVPMALYVGAQYDPKHSTNGFSILFAYILSQALVWFVVIYFMSLVLENEPVWKSRNDVCAYTWRHALALGLITVFLDVLWMILFLWGALFKLLDIGIFQELFENRRFIYPAFGLAGGFAVIALRGQINAVGMIERVASALSRVLLPLLALIVLLFLAVLPFTGVHALWETGHGSVLMMVLASLMLLFVNVSYYGEPPKFQRWLRWLVLVALLLLPVTLGLSVWAITLRVDQYGWSLSRLWAAVILFGLSIFSLGYSYAIIRKREQWLDWLPVINKVNGIVVAILLIFTASPVLNLPRLAASSQASRLLSGKVAPDQFDFSYLRFDLGEPGYNELVRLQKSPALAKEPAIAKRIAYILKVNSSSEVGHYELPVSVDEAKKKIQVFAKESTVPAGLFKVIAGERQNHSCFKKTGNCKLIAVHMLDRSMTYYVLINTSQYGYANQKVYGFEHGKWAWIASFDISDNPAKALRALISGNYKFEEPEYPDLVIGSKHLRVTPK